MISWLDAKLQKINGFRSWFHCQWITQRKHLDRFIYERVSTFEWLPYMSTKKILMIWSFCAKYRICWRWSLWIGGTHVFSLMDENYRLLWHLVISSPEFKHQVFSSKFSDKWFSMDTTEHRRDIIIWERTFQWLIQREKKKHKISVILPMTFMLIFLVHYDILEMQKPIDYLFTYCRYSR